MKEIDNIEFDGIDYSDYPDFCDAFICSADIDGREMTDDELDELNNDREFVSNALQNYLFWWIKILPYCEMKLYLL